MRKSMCFVLLILVLSFAGYASDVSAASSIPSNVNTNTAAAASKKTIASIDMKKIKGKLKNIYYYDKNKVLIVSDKLYLYDLATGTVLYETQKTEFELEGYYPIDGGFVAVGMLFESAGSGLSMRSGMNGMTCIFYDSKLNETNRISLNTLLGKNEYTSLSPQTVAISKDGTKLTFATDRGLYLYDIKNKKKTTLVNLSDNNAAKRFGLVGFDALAFVSDGNKITFKSQSFDVPAKEGKPSFDTCGSVLIDGSSLTVSRPSDYTVKEMTAYNSFVFFAEDFTVPSGKLMIFDVSTGNSKILKTKTTKESGDLFGSDNGAYFATSSISKKTITVRVYDTKDGSIIFEKAIETEEQYAWRTPKIGVIDDLRTLIILLGSGQDDIDTKCLIYNF